MIKERIAIVVLHWNAYDETVECLNSVIQRTDLKKEVYLVDNGSSNDSLLRLKKKFKSINYVELSENSGFAKGMNAGISAALKEKAKAILLLNNDTVMGKESLPLLLKKLFSKNNTGAVVPMVYLGKTGKTIGSLGGEINWKLGEARQMHHLEKDNDRYESEEVEFAPASAVIIRAEVAEKYPVPEDYFMYSEDVDWSMQIRKAGYKILTEPKAKIWHNESASSGQFSRFKIYYYCRNILIFMKKYCPKESWDNFLRDFNWKLAKMWIKFLLRGKFSLVKASITGCRAFWNGETGKSEAV